MANERAKQYIVFRPCGCNWVGCGCDQEVDVEAHELTAEELTQFDAETRYQIRLDLEADGFELEGACFCLRAPVQGETLCPQCVEDERIACGTILPPPSDHYEAFPPMPELHYASEVAPPDMALTVPPRRMAS